jgi:hypothetical protein
MASENIKLKAWRAPKLHRLQVQQAEAGGSVTGDGGPQSKKS